MAVGANEIIPGPMSTFRSLSVVATPQKIKGDGGKIFELFITNSAAATRFVKFYDMLAAPTVGTTIPVYTLLIEKSPNGQINFVSDPGWNFVNGIWVAATTAVTDADTGAPAANDVVINVNYK